jgi:hypothetical protein
MATERVCQFKVIALFNLADNLGKLNRILNQFHKPNLVGVNARPPTEVYE